MSLNKKLLAGAIVGVLFSATAGAATLGTARTYASELSAPVDLSADAGDTVDFALGYNFSPSEVRYGRFECTTNMTMDNVTVTSADTTKVDLGSLNGEGTSALFFSLTADPTLATATDTLNISVDGDNTLLDGGDVNCAWSIYDQPSQAQAGGATGRIYTTGFLPFINRAPSFVFTGEPGEAVADVEATNGAYTDFDGERRIGALTFGLADDVPLDKDGTVISLSDIFSSDTYVTIDGDMSAVQDGGYVRWDGALQDVLSEDSAEFDTGANTYDGNIRYHPNGDTPIPEGDFTATLHADTNAGYEVSDVGPVDVGSIVRNGTQLQAPLANVPAGWISRMVLTNTGGTDRPYEISVMGETGNTIGTDNLTGTVPANGTKVVDLNTVMTSFTGKARGTVNVTVAAPNNQIQGLLQIVSDSGAISNETMVRPGTN
jgi:hypothetical protein